jgi:hypothetical protein
MTSVAWDGVTLAADRQAVHNNTPVLWAKLRKITFRGEPAYLAFAGEIDQCNSVVDWIVAGCDPDKIPVIETKNFSILVITKSKKAFYLNDGFFFYEMGKSKWAIGSGADFALGAMAHGATAEEAVGIACTLDVNSGLGVDSVKPGRM